MRDVSRMATLSEFRRKGHRMEKNILVVDDSRFIFEEMKYKMRGCERYKISY